MSPSNGIQHAASGSWDGGAVFTKYNTLMFNFNKILYFDLCCAADDKLTLFFSVNQFSDWKLSWLGISFCWYILILHEWIHSWVVIFFVSTSRNCDYIVCQAFCSYLTGERWLYCTMCNKLIPHSKNWTIFFAKSNLIAFIIEQLLLYMFHLTNTRS